MRDKKTFYLHVIIMLCIMFCGWIIPPFHASITPLGMRAIGIFFGVIYGWMMLDLLLPSLVGRACFELYPTDMEVLNHAEPSETLPVNG